MANTLYDLLEVSTSASQESITVSYQRLHAHYAALQSSSDGEDATNRLIALREAYTTLSNAERRKAYDEKLAARAAAEVVQEAQPRSYISALLLAAVIGTSGLGYANYQSNREQAALEKERAAVRLAEIEAQRAREQEQSERMAARQADYQRQQAESRERYERERDLAYGRQISRDIQRGEAMVQQEKQREEQRKLRDEQQRQYEAERRLAQDKATVRRMEAENNRRYY